MLMILEIAFTVAAWRKGWRGWALLPLCGAFLLVVVAVAAVGPGAAKGFGLLADLGCTAVLFVMSRRGPVPASEAATFVGPASAGRVSAGD